VTRLAPVSLLALATLSVSTSAQNPLTKPPAHVRDTAAITLLQKSVSAMGGASGWGSVQDWVITGSMSGGASARVSKTFSWTGAGVEFRLEVDGSNSTNVFVSGHGTPARIFNGTASPINYHVARANPPLYLPAVLLLQEVNNSLLTVHYLGPTTVNGLAAVQVHISDDSDATGSLVTSHDWYFDPVSFLPLHVEFRIPANENAADYSKGSFDFSKFQPINGMLVPFQVSLSRNSAPSKTFVVRSVTFNSGVSPSVFDAPKGAGQ
jgi:hypothetical protein